MASWEPSVRVPTDSWPSFAVRQPYDFVPMLRHILLTITAILLAMLSDFLCRKILVPLISKITDKTDITWVIIYVLHPARL